MIKAPTAAALCLLATVACRRGAPPDSVAPPAAGHPELPCPPGTLPAGQGPPLGQEAWCEVTTPSQGRLREGPSLTWHPNGRRASEGAYRAGLRQGPWQFWHPSGAPERQGNYAQDLPEGPWTTYHPDGSRASMGGYVAGEEHGPWVYWDVGAVTRTEGSYELGKRTGRWLDLGPDGQAVRERIYRNGRLINQRELGG